MLPAAEMLRTGQIFSRPSTTSRIIFDYIVVCLLVSKDIERRFVKIVKIAAAHA
jgi:hypothetical protein